MSYGLIICFFTEQIRIVNESLNIEIRPEPDNDVYVPFVVFFYVFLIITLQEMFCYKYHNFSNNLVFAKIFKFRIRF